MYADDYIFGYMNPYEDEEIEEVGQEDCPDHLEHTAIMENEDE